MTASSEPCTSALMIRLSDAFSPDWIWLNRSSSLVPDLTRASSRRCLAFNRSSRASPTVRAVFSSGAARNSSPASGTVDRPSTWTGVDGPADLTCSPLSLIIARTLPHAAPATIGSPTLSSPLSTSTVATGPRPLSSWASITMPLARPVGLAVSSSSSATTCSCSIRSSTPTPWSADISTTIVSPPHDSGTSSYSASCVSTRCGSALALSILLTATTIGTSAAWAWLMASIVWGMMPSSAATISTTMSVASAPRARICVNAAWPGVSRNVTEPCSLTTV